MMRLTAYEIAANPDDVIATHAGPDRNGKYRGCITRGDRRGGCRYRQNHHHGDRSIMNERIHVAVDAAHYPGGIFLLFQNIKKSLNNF
jgi:hypothetical protein